MLNRSMYSPYFVITIVLKDVCLPELRCLVARVQNITGFLFCVYKPPPEMTLLYMKPSLQRMQIHRTPWVEQRYFTQLSTKPQAVRNSC